jgi:hypothetical protein
MTIQKKGWYFYLICALTVIAFPLALTGLLALKEQWINETLWTEMGKTATHCWMVLIEIMFISQIFKHDAGYTVVTTTEYKLFKCKESGKEDAFMMFADSTEELEHFFEVTEPTKKIYIEEAEMTGKSIQMKVFNGDDVK